MPTLTIRVQDAPKRWTCYAEVRCLLQTKHGVEEPIRFEDVTEETHTPIFNVPFQMSSLGGKPHPVGEAVQRANDGGRFIYIQWWGVRDGRAETFRRLKVPFSQVLDFGDGSQNCEITVRGMDTKGGPYCATAIRV